MPRGDQTIRQWRVLRMLEASQCGLRAREIHDQLEGEVTERTVFRDLEQLQAAGFPLYQEEGRWTVLRSDNGRAAVTVPVRPSDLLALLVSEDLFEPVQGSVLAEGLSNLRDTLLTLLTPAGRRHVDELRSKRVATFTAPSDYAEHTPVLRTLEDAVARGRRVRMHYCKPGPAGAERTERTVDPYMLWHLDGRVRLVGWCHLRQTRRRFLIERIESVEVLDESFEPDPTFDPREHVQHGFGGWDGPPERVVVDFTPAVAHLLSERRFHPHQRVEPLADGGGRLVMHVPGIPRLAAWVASFGGLVVAREPRRLVDAVRAMHAAGLQAHGAAASDTEGHDPV